MDTLILTGWGWKEYAVAAAVALKALGGIPDKVDLIDSAVIEPIQRLKVENFGSVNPRLHTDEGVLTSPCIIRKNTQIPNTDRQVSCHPLKN